MQESGATTILQLASCALFILSVQPPSRLANQLLPASSNVRPFAIVRIASQFRDSVSDNRIMATCHGAAPASSANPDTALLTDIDLAILGAPTARFADYERQIRAEYAWVAPEVFAVKRRAVLRGFLERPVICAMPILHQRLERLAHDNLRRATADSQSGLPKPHQ